MVCSFREDKPTGPQGANRPFYGLAKSSAQVLSDPGPVSALAGLAAVTGRYARAARALLGWTQQDLAKAANVGVRTVKRFENDEDTRPAQASSIRRAFETAGLRVFEDARELAKLEGEIGVAIVLAPQ